MRSIVLTLVMLGIMAANQAAAAPAKNKVVKMGLTSSTLQAGAAVPAAYTCDVAGVPYAGGNNPDVAWSKAPKKTKYFAIIAYDKISSLFSFYHWGLFNIPAAATSLPAGGSAGTTTFNDGGLTIYYGPCPPLNEAAHTYTFEVYALKKPLPLAADVMTSELHKALKGAHKSKVIGKGKLVVTYGGAVPTTEGGCLGRGGLWTCIDTVCSCQ